MKCIKPPIIREDLRLKTRNVLYPPGLYKGLVWQEGGNNKLLYCGVLKISQAFRGSVFRLSVSFPQSC